MDELFRLEDVRDKLFYDTFLVNVPNRAFHTAYELEEFGILSHGSEELDNAYLEDFRLVKATLVDIALWIDEGVKVCLYDKQDATAMFKIIDTHLDNWLKISKANPAAILPPFEDIEKLDNLAKLLFPWSEHREEANDLSIYDDLAFLGNALDMRFVKRAEAYNQSYEEYAPKLFDRTLRRWEVNDGS